MLDVVVDVEGITEGHVEMLEVVGSTNLPCAVRASLWVGVCACGGGQGTYMYVVFPNKVCIM